METVMMPGLVTGRNALIRDANLATTPADQAHALLRQIAISDFADAGDDLRTAAAELCEVGNALVERKVATTQKLRDPEFEIDGQTAAQLLKSAEKQRKEAVADTVAYYVDLLNLAQ